MGTIEDVNDDMKRELALHNHALEGCKRLLRALVDQGESVRRPDDYYAEMVKTDDHMGKVKRKLLQEKRALELKQEKRQRALMRKYGKQVKAERTKERKQEQKASAEESASKLANGTKRKRESTTATQRKRAAKDAKYGFGGKKSLNKQNDAASAHDMSTYKPATFDKGIKVKGAGKLKPNSGAAKSKAGKSPVTRGKRKKHA